ARKPRTVARDRAAIDRFIKDSRDEIERVSRAVARWVMPLLTSCLVLRCGPSEPSSCRAWAAAMCSNYQQCDPDYIMTEFGDESTCTTRFELDCAAKSAAPGSGIGEPWLGACAAALMSTTCDEF